MTVAEGWITSTFQAIKLTTINGLNGEDNKSIVGGKWE